jgi:hypothetical protein
MSIGVLVARARFVAAKERPFGDPFRCAWALGWRWLGE